VTVVGNGERAESLSPDSSGRDSGVEEIGRINSFLERIAARHESALQDGNGLRLNEMEVYQLCDLIGVERCSAECLAVDADEESRRKWAEFALRMAGEHGRFLMKVVGRSILHKTDVGGVRMVDVAPDTSVADVLAASDRLLAAMGEVDLGDAVEGILAAAFVPHQANRPGQELLISLRQDPAFGACIVVGIGGTLTEWYGRGSDRGSTLIFPAAALTPDFVRSSLESHPLLSLVCVPSRLYRKAPVDTEIIVRTVVALADLGKRCGPAGGDSPWTLEEIEINPAVASAERLVALDGVGLLSRRKWQGANRPVAKIGPLLAPRSAVVLGVSAKGANPGRIILDNLLRSEGIPRENLYVVHHKESEISGVPCYRSVAELPCKCDLAVVSVPARGALDTIGDLVGQDKAESIILIPGGFAETGETGLAEAIESVLVEGHAAPGGGPVMVGGNCLGIVSRDNYNTFFLPEYKLPFRPGRGENLAVVSQSGAYLVTFASNYDGLIYPRASISFGNQMDLTVSDFLEHFSAESGINVIACYVEGFRPGDGERFLHFARLAQSHGKRVIIFKAGKTALGAKAAASHTASLAGDYAVARACLESAGVTVAETLDEFEDLLKTFTLLASKTVAGNRVGIISNAGFECSTVMDQLDGLRLAEFDPGTQGILDEVLPPFAHRSNPIDCTPMTGTAAYCDSCQAILDSAAVDVAILSAVPVTPALDNLPADADAGHRENLAGPDSQASRMIATIAGSAKPAVVVVDSGEIYDPMCVMMEAAGVPVFRKIDRAARALAAYSRGEGAD